MQSPEIARSAIQQDVRVKSSLQPFYLLGIMCTTLCLIKKAVEQVAVTDLETSLNNISGISSFVLFLLLDILTSHY